MAKSGFIKTIKYNAEGGVAGTTWNVLGVIPPSVLAGVSFALAVTWENTGDEAFEGHVDLDLTDPSGTVTDLVASSGQDVSVAAGGEKEVVFPAVTLSTVGTYAADITLTEHDHTTVYDENSVQVATVSAAPTAGIDITEMMNLMITMMIIGMMMKMMTGMMKES